MYLPTSKLSFTTFQVTFSGSFFETGVKKPTTAFSIRPYQTQFERGVMGGLRVVVDSILRLRGGGEGGSSVAGAALFVPLTAILQDRGAYLERE